MTTTLSMSMSLNGFIAREDGNEDFLPDASWLAFSSLVEEYGNLIVGSKTFDVVQAWENEYNFDIFTKAAKVVISTQQKALPDGYTLCHSPQEALNFLAAKGFNKALLAGGSGINGAFLAAGLIDEVILNINPVLIGKGIPLVSPQMADLDLKLVKVEQKADGIVTMHYTK